MCSEEISCASTLLAWDGDNWNGNQESMATIQNHFALSSFKPLRNFIVALLLCIAACPKLSAQTNDWPQNFAVIPILLNNPAAMDFVSNLMSEPQPALAIPEFSPTNTNPEGTFWMLTKGAPMPYNPFPALPVYQVGTNSTFIVDDRSVDYAGLNAELQAENEANPITNPPVTISSIDTNGLWIQVPTNSLATNGYFAVNLMNTLEDQSYDVLTTPYLSGLWATELTVTGAVGNVTPATVPMNGRTNLFVWARTSAAYSFYLVTEPLSQEVWDGDDVTFTVATGGNANLSYQWTLEGNPIPGATNSTYTIYGVQDSDAGHYACIISDGVNTIVTGAAQLKTDGFSGDPLIIPVVSSRQSYHFKSGITYYIGGQIQLFGETTIDAGAVLKLDYNPQRVTNSSLIVMGGLICNTEAYNPAILTTVDDDADGEPFSFSTGSAQTVSAGVPFLDLTSSTSNSISNLRFLFADWAVTTPVNTLQLDVWDCQFVNCNYGVVNLAEGNSVDRLHNVLFAGCEAAVGASSNSISIQGEHVTADVADFCLADTTPSAIALTNSIVWGSSLSASSVSTVDVAMNPDNTNFVSAGEGNYYLAGNSPLHFAGTANISARLQSEFQHKTTYAPFAINNSTQISGQVTLAPQALRYTNGAPDYGYYYDALDYTAAALFVSGGGLNILPGTAIGFRNDYLTNSAAWTTYGCVVYNGGSVVSHGTPVKPNVFTSLDRVQETPNFAFAEYVVSESEYSSSLLPGICSFVTDLEPGDVGAPSLDFRFSQFYLPSDGLHICSGMSFDGAWVFTSSAGVNLNLQDCGMHNGQIDLGEPGGAPGQVYGSGIVGWTNTLFENVSVNLDPTANVDLSFQAVNNLFRGGFWLHIEPVIPASTGYWLFENNLFDQVDFIQDTNQPLDYAYNGYWPLSTHAVEWNYMIEPQWWPNTANSLQMTTTADGFSDGQWEQYLSAAPPYQSGTFGNYYLPNSTLLYGAGSTNAASLGLYHYTTQTNQSKEGTEAPGHMVNIGLHYVAANASGVPVDADNDDIPDYVEDANGNGIVEGNETDWLNPMTDGVNPDASNAVYLNIDLSGDGLVGRVKSVLGMKPLDSGNPLTLTQIVTGDEPDIVTYKVPINYTTLTNVGELNLNIDGTDVTLSDIAPASDGSSLIEWNTTYNSPGQHYLQPQLTLFSSDGDFGVFLGMGKLVPFTSTNVLQFFESDSMFDDTGAYLDAQLPEQDANYTIQLYDPSTTPPTLINTITGSTSDGMIQEDWDLTYSDGVTIFTNETFNAVFNVTLLDPSSGTHTKVYNKLSSNEQGNGFDAIYVYTPTNSLMVNEFGDDNGNYDGVVWTGMQNVIDTLMMPVTADGGHADNYDSDFDIYTSQDFPGQIGYPGYITSQTNGIHSVLNGLFPSLTNGTTKNFYSFAHGSTNRIGNGAGNVVIDTAGIGYILQNHYSARGGLNTKNPYRFVFLDGCSTAKSQDWRRAFGIFPLDAPNQAARNKVGPQAFVGWAVDHTGWMNQQSNSIGSLDEAFAATETLADFYESWMDGSTLAQCIQIASTPGVPNTAPFPVLQNGTSQRLTGDGIDGYSYNFVVTNIVPSKISVIGHSGLTRSSVNGSQDGLYP